MNTYNFLPEISNLVFLQQLLKNYGFYGNNGTGKVFFLSKFLLQYRLFLAINLAALNNLLQMFSNNININGNKAPLLPPPPPSNTGLNSQLDTNQSLNIPDQQHALNSPRIPPPNLNTTTYNNESSLLLCGTNVNGQPANHHNQNGTPGNPAYPPTLPSMYANNANSLSNGCAGKRN